jgi:hypothetical protein
VFAQFSNREILGEQGRLLFCVLNAFSLSGYRILLWRELPEESLGKYGQLIHSLKGVTLADAPPSETDDLIYLFDREDRRFARHPWRKKIEVKFDIFSRYWLGDPIILPFPMHPAHAGADLPQRLQSLRQTERKVRIFFAGDTNGYVRNRIRYPREKLPRLEVINTILERMGDKALSVDDGNALQALLSLGDYSNKCVVVDANRFRIDEQRWLSTVARADFFLCPPGYVMPMCHNAVEAMAVGAIPLIGYPEWFQPGLRHMQDCVAFGDKKDLIAMVNQILEMDDEQISEMRRRVIEYYDRHLVADSFIRRIEAARDRKIVMLVISERYVAENASKLGKHSVLIHGTAEARTAGWRSTLRRIAA